MPESEHRIVDLISSNLLQVNACIGTYSLEKIGGRIMVRRSNEDLMKF